MYDFGRLVRSVLGGITSRIEDIPPFGEAYSLRYMRNNGTYLTNPSLYQIAHLPVKENLRFSAWSRPDKEPDYADISHVHFAEQLLQASSLIMPYFISISNNFW